MTICEYCNIEFDETRYKQRFCSINHALKFRYENGFKANTENAHKVLREKGHYKRDNSYLVERNPATTEIARKKISEAKLKSNWMKGRRKELHPNWKGGLHYTIWKSPEYQSWRKAVFKRDNYTCVLCGDNKGGNLEADHIKPRYRFPELTFDIDNGRSLCHTCHIKTDTYGDKVKRIGLAKN